MKKVDPIDTKFCRFLKAKNSFGTMEGGGNTWYTHADANSIYWCIKSLGPGGPDNGPVDPRLCVSGRKCWR
ncbi:MAG: hypothetical protein AABY93_10990 [Bacteroidota bacterium]